MQHKQIIYNVGVPSMLISPSGRPIRSVVQHVEVTEDATILGCARACEVAIRISEGRGFPLTEGYSAYPEPNAAELGWAVGT